jgi:hypothetical protein
MTKLEEEIEDAIISCIARGTVENGDVAKAAAEVAKRYIEKAYIEGYYALANITK